MSEPSKDAEASRQSDEQASLTEAQRQQLVDDELQAKYRREYLRQLQQRDCPGCGEVGLF